MKYQIAAPSAASLISILLLALLMGGIFAVIISARYYRLEITESRLVIRSILYNTSVGLGDIDAERARIVNLDAEGFGISTRTNGIGLPGLSVGWFAGREGKMKLYVTDRSSVLYLPTRLGYGILFSTADGPEIIGRLRSREGK